MTTVAVRVPEQDLGDLLDLVDVIGGAATPDVAHPFDGETVAQVVLVLGPTTFPFFKTWIQQRVAQRKQSRVVLNGTELRGYTAAEVERIINVVATTGQFSETSDEATEGDSRPGRTTQDGGNR